MGVKIIESKVEVKNYTIQSKFGEKPLIAAFYDGLMRVSIPSFVSTIGYYQRPDNLRRWIQDEQVYNFVNPEYVDVPVGKQRRTTSFVSLYQLEEAIKSTVPNNIKAESKKESRTRALHFIHELLDNPSLFNNKKKNEVKKEIKRSKKASYQTAVKESKKEEIIPVIEIKQHENQVHGKLNVLISRTDNLEIYWYNGIDAARHLGIISINRALSNLPEKYKYQYRPARNVIRTYISRDGIVELAKHAHIRPESLVLTDYLRWIDAISGVNILSEKYQVDPVIEMSKKEVDTEKEKVKEWQSKLSASTIKKETAPTQEPSNNIISFNNVRGYIDKEGTAWLNLNDVAFGFGYTHKAPSGNTVVRWDRVNKYLEEFNFVPTGGYVTSQTEEEKMYIPESIVYRLGFKANNKVAQAFQAKLADEILPNIRKHGAYMTESTIEKALTSPDFLIQLAMKLKEEQAKNKELTLIHEENKPKIEFYHAVKASNSCISVKCMANLLNKNGIPTGEQRLFEWLREKGYLCSKKSLWNQPTQRALNSGLIVSEERVVKKPSYYNDGKNKIYFVSLVTPKGQEFFLKQFLKEGGQ